MANQKQIWIPEGQYILLSFASSPSVTPRLVVILLYELLCVSLLFVLYRDANQRRSCYCCRRHVSIFLSLFFFVVLYFGHLSLYPWRRVSPSDSLFIVLISSFSFFLVKSVLQKPKSITSFSSLIFFWQLLFNSYLFLREINTQRFFFKLKKRENKSMPRTCVRLAEHTHASVNSYFFSFLPLKNRVPFSIFVVSS